MRYEARLKRYAEDTTHEDIWAVYDTSTMITGQLEEVTWSIAYDLSRHWARGIADLMNQAYYNGQDDKQNEIKEVLGL